LRIYVNTHDFDDKNIYVDLNGQIFGELKLKWTST
jgi:hypothetical protein